MILICPQCRKDWPLAGKAEGQQWLCTCGNLLTAPAPKPFHAPVWHCGACGAGLPVGAKECSYCGTGLRSIDGKAYCARCLAYLESDAQYCSHCGAHASDASHIPDESDHSCPRCGDEVRLVGVPVGLQHGEACPRCEGLWLEQTVFAKVVADFSSPERQRPMSAGIVRPEPLHPEGSKTFEAVVKYLPCPKCTTRMARRNYLRVSGIILDICPEHGIWFDREELRLVAAFLQEGGVARFQKAEAEETGLQIKRKAEIRRIESQIPRNTEVSMTWPAGINDRPSFEVSSLVSWLLGALFKS